MGQEFQRIKNSSDSRDTTWINGSSESRDSTSQEAQRVKKSNESRAFWRAKGQPRSGSGSHTEEGEGRETMTSSTALKPLLDFASGNPSADDLDKMALVVGFMREPVPVTGRAAGPLAVISVDMFEKENAKDNFTTFYKQVYGQFPSSVLRRGSRFRVGIRFNQEVELDNLDVKVNLALGLNPTIRDGTLVKLQLPTLVDDKGTAQVKLSQWSISVTFHQRDMVLVMLRSPATTPVGRWTLSFQVGAALQTMDRKIYVVCNPWLQGDPVFMKNEEEREFYTIKDSCNVYLGTYESFYPKQWFLGQFNKATLEVIEFLLRESGLTAAQRADQAMLVRTLSAVVNSNDDNGLVYGLWDGIYAGGTNPLAWNSSPPIINQFFEAGGNNVKYGQCMVFGALLTTLLRAVGVPSRMVSNFPSAHVEGGDMTVHYRFDEFDRYIQGNDMEWNFHVWAECWMTRPDLPKGFDGWQVVDGTPQVPSQSGKFEVGPYPVKAILQDNTDLKFDGKYATAAIKAVYKYYRKDPTVPGGWTLLATYKDRAGRLLLTEKLIPPGQEPEPEDVTHNYRARTSSPRTQITEAMELKLECAPAVPVGEAIQVVCRATNNDKLPHDVTVSVRASSVEYNNAVPEEVGCTSQRLKMAPGIVESVELKMYADSYLGKLRPQGMIRIDAVATFKDGFASARVVVVVKMPALNVEVLSRDKPLGALKYKLSLFNPLTVPLTDCKLIVELPGSTQLLTQTAVGNVPPGRAFEKTGVLFVTSTDTKTIVATFMSKQLPVVTGITEF